MPNILVIDDDQIVGEMISLALREDGYCVACAADGLRGEGIMDTSPVDIVITDINMPEQDGIQTIMNIRRRWPSVGIIAISGRAGLGKPGYLRHARLLGAVEALEKPFSVGQLREAVEACMTVRAVGATTFREVPGEMVASPPDRGLVIGLAAPPSHRRDATQWAQARTERCAPNPTPPLTAMRKRG